MEIDKKKLFMFIWVIILFIIVVIAVKYKETKITTETKTENGNVLVTNYSRFFTISGCVNKYISFLNNSDSDSLYKLLSKAYIKTNEITKDNILTKLNKPDGIYNFEARKIYQKEDDNNTIRYYVYGYLTKELMDLYVQPTNYYVIVLLDTKNSLFSITPYDGKLFKEAE